ncbi:MAG: FtsW/RodA/SpoVE family cell cycle protein [Spirosomataceae bacterium]
MKTWLQENLKGDYQIWIIVCIMTVLSMLAVYSATGTLAYKNTTNSEMYLIKHLFGYALGLGFLWVIHRTNYMVFATKASYYLLWISLALVWYANLMGVKINDASRWIRIPFIGLTFQPSDLAKLALIANLAAMLAKRQHKEYTNDPEQLFRMLMPMIFWIGVICSSIAVSNGSTAILLGGTCFLLMFIGRVPPRYLMMLVLVCSLLGGIGLATGDRWKTVQKRIDRFKSHEDEKKDDSQLVQGYIAIAEGGLIGRGPGRSLQRNYLPEAYSDSIYAIIVEEYGYIVGGIGTLMLYLWLLYRGMKAIARSDRAFGGLLSAGLTFLIVIQALIHICVSTGLMPYTGQTLPMISMGGSSQWATAICIGIVLSISRKGIPEATIK